MDSCVNSGSTGEGSHDFARARRIVKTDEFSSVFRLRPTQKTAHFVLYARPNTLPHARLGVGVAKRFAPRAVTRNTIKRQVYSLGAEFAPLLKEKAHLIRLRRDFDRKVFVSATSDALKAAVRSELMDLFGQIVGPLPSKVGSDPSQVRP